MSEIDAEDSPPGRDWRAADGVPLAVCKIDAVHFLPGRPWRAADGVPLAVCKIDLGEPAKCGEAESQPDPVPPLHRAQVEIAGCVLHATPWSMVSVSRRPERRRTVSLAASDVEGARLQTTSPRLSTH